MFYFFFLNWCEITREDGTEIVTDVTSDLYHASVAYFAIRRFNWACRVLGKTQQK